MAARSVAWRVADSSAGDLTASLSVLVQATQGFRDRLEQENVYGPEEITAAEAALVDVEAECSQAQ